MINHLSIRDFATIENTDVDFQKGLNIITGETGSGKSIVIEAISLALGSRADKTFVRSGCEKATVQMIAEYENKEILITRELSSTGKNICKIDDRIVTLNELSDICSKIADIHGQYETQSLLKTENHIKLVDAYEKGSIEPCKMKVSECYENYSDVNTRFDEMQKQAANNMETKELLQYRIDEIDAANLISGEDLSHKEELLIIENNERIFNALSQAYMIAYEKDDSALERINSVISPLRDITSLSKESFDIEDEISDIYYRFEDLANRIRDMRDHIIFNEARIEELHDRLNFIDDLKKKYGDTIDDVLATRDRMERELKTLNNLDKELESLHTEKFIIKEMLIQETENLTRLRKSSAGVLQEKIQAELENLNFKNAKFSINFAENSDFTPTGVDKVEFLLSTNIGEEQKSLSKIASGGEMSRIMLAFKKIISEYDGISSIIFDEIDTGISGETASVVAKELSKISEHHQLICITHLPQIAAAGEHNYRIQKSSDDSCTYTTITVLNEREKVTEIARLLSGLNVSDITLANAQEMISLVGKH